MARVRIISWNVNGLRACAKKGFLEWLSASGGQIVGLQEVRALEEQLPDEVRSPPRWHTCFHAAERKGYSGVGLYSRKKPDRVETSLGDPLFDCEGRYLLARFGKLVVVNAYFPKGSGKDRDNSRVGYKLDFYRAVFERIQKARRGGYRVIVVGDYNTAHREIDLARPRDNVKNSGFLPEERAELDRWIEAGWVDTFRHLEPGPGHYTWWRQWGGAREKNVGWRIDYALASPSAVKFLQRAWIRPDVTHSDHCPIGVDLDPAVLG